jgi:hypothetical protein
MTLLALLTPVALVAFQTPEFRPEERAWRERDLEARWVLVEREMSAHGWSNVTSLTKFLEERREVELLERLCLYPREEGQFATFERALRELDAPHWARAVEWNLRQHDSHTRDHAHSAFLELRPALARGWLERHESELRPLAGAVLAKLRASAIEPESAAAQLAPWNVEELLAPLQRAAAGASTVEFGERLRATPGELYLHSVEAALRALAQRQLYEEPWRTALFACTRHTQPPVRAFAWIALGQAARGVLPVEALDDLSLRACIEAKDEDLRVRRAATLALGQRAAWSPFAWLELHRIAGERAHPAWSAAVSALADCGDEFTLEQLEGLLPTLNVETERRLANSTCDALRERGAIASQSLTQTFERTALASAPVGRLESVPFARRLTWHARSFAAVRVDAELGKQILELRKTYEPAADVLAQAQRVAPNFELQAAVRELATR